METTSPLPACGPAGHHGVNSPAGRGPLTLPSPRPAPPYPSPRQWTLPLLPPLRLQRGWALVKEMQIKAPGHPRPLPEVLRVTVPSAHTLSSCSPQEAPGDPELERVGGWKTAVAPGPEKAVGCSSRTAVRFQEGLPSRPPPTPQPPTPSSCFLQHKDHTGHTLPVAPPAHHLPRLAPLSRVPRGLSFPSSRHLGLGAGTHRRVAGLGAGCGDPQASGGPPGRR